MILCCSCNKPKRSIKALDKEQNKYQPTWESLSKAPVAPWFDDAKFGIFIHWGAYSVIGHRKGGRGYAEHVPKMLYSDPEYYYPYLDEHFGSHPPEFGYKDIVKQFKAQDWNPDEWATLFKDSGAKYVVLTAEHHDGYALWDSELTDWCATKVGPMRDLVGDLGKAVRAKGMKYAPSYHRERHTGFFAKDIYKIESAPKPDIEEEIKRKPKAAGLYGPFTYTDEFIKDYGLRWKEIQEKYQPDFMWIDDIPIFYKDKGLSHPQAQKFQDSFQPLIADYFNAAQEWGKDVYLNNKGGNLNWPDGPGCLEKDNLKLTKIGPKWENPATLGTSYGYMKEEEEQDAYKSPEELIQLLCDVVSKNGNLLLNIGPKADGNIPEGMKARLLEMGKWLSVNGEAIYGSRTWQVYGEGPLVKKDDQSDQRMKRHERVAFTNESIRYTRSKGEGTIYAIQLNPLDDNCVANSITSKSLDGKKIKRISVLGSDQKVNWELGDDELVMNIESNEKPLYSRVWKIELQ